MNLIKDSAMSKITISPLRQRMIEDMKARLLAGGYLGLRAGAGNGGLPR